MKWEHKIGIALTCTFLCLVGAVIGLKMRVQTSPQSSEVAQRNSDEAAEPTVGSPLPSPGGNTGQEPSRRVPSPNNDPTLDFTGHEPPPNMGIKDETANAAKNGKGAALKPRKETGDSALPGFPPSPATELKPHKIPAAGAGEWNIDAEGSKDKKQEVKPAAPNQNTKPASPLLDVKTQPVVKPPAPSGILPMSSSEPSLALPEQSNKPSPSTPAGSGSSLPSSTQANAANSAAPPLSIMPSYMARPTTAPRVSEPKANENASPSSVTAAPPKLTATPISASPPVQAPVPLTTPDRVAPIPTTPASVPASTSPTPLAPASSPEGISGTFTPAPAPRISSQQGADAPRSPAPPKPPAEGSSFVPDNPSSTNGPVGVKPAPLPLPVPPSSPLAAIPNKPTPTPMQSANNSPGVTVYDEQDYSCRPGDSWAEISKRFFMTDQYAKALQRHNQNHARASDRMRDTGQVAPGERIFVPQSYVLEQRYGDAIVKPAATSASPTMPVSYPSASPAPAPPPNR